MRVGEREGDGAILPVFAGMIPRMTSHAGQRHHYPRIRGDNLSGNTTEECIDGED